MKHEYLSTACAHGLHQHCRVTCKFCKVQCNCPHCDHSLRSEVEKSLVDLEAKVYPPHTEWWIKPEEGIKNP